MRLQQRQRQQKVEEEPDHLPLGTTAQVLSLSSTGSQLLQASPLHVGGQRVDCLFDILRSALRRDIGEVSKSGSNKQFMRKCKVLFCIGVNNVTRTLERMPCTYKGFGLMSEREEQAEEIKTVEKRKGARGTSLEVVIVAIDVHPRLLISHFPGLAASRKVPLITLSGGNGSGSLRLGELFHLRTAIAIGLKAGDSESNQAIRCILEDWSVIGTT